MTEKYPGSNQNIWQSTDEAPVTSFAIDTQRRDIDVASDILELQPNETPFLVIGGRASKKPVTSLETVWYDDELAAWWTTSDDDGTDGEILAATTEFDVDDVSIFKPKDIIKVARTGEVMMVESITGDEIKVKRGYSHESTGGVDYGTEAANFYTSEHATEDADNLMRMGNAMEENSLAPEPRATQPGKLWNYVQTFRTPFSGSFDDLAEQKKTNENERTRLRRRKAVEHRLDLERALLFGEKKEVIADKRRLMGGLFQFLNDQYDSVDITNNQDNFESFLEDAFWYGSSQKLMLTSPRVGSEINKFARDKIQTRSGEDFYGLQISEYQSFHGRLFIATSQMFEKDYRDKAVVLDMENIDIMPYDGQDTTLSTNLQENDRDGWLDEYMTKMTMRVRLLKTHRVLENALG